MLAISSSLCAAAAIAAGIFLDRAVVARAGAADGAVESYARHWLAIYRDCAWSCGVALGLVAACLLVRPAAADRWIARRWLLLRRLALSLTSLLLTAVVVEAAARVLDAHAPRSLQGDEFDARGREFMRSVQPQLNADGMRDDPFDRSRAAGQSRVLLIGDSFAFGFGVAERDATFAAALERSLASHGTFDVFNAGVPGADSRRELDVFLASSARVDPDVSLIAWFVNDSESETDKRAYVRQRRLLPIVSDTLLQWSAAWGRIEPALVSVLVRIGVKSDCLRHLRHLYGLGNGGTWSQRAEFVQLLDEARAGGRRVAVVLFPMLEDLVHYPLEDVHTLVAAACAEREVPCIDLLATFRGESAESLQASENDHHMNAVAAARAAGAVADFLAREGVLESWRPR